MQTPFRTSLSQTVFKRYQLHENETWQERVTAVVNSVCRGIMSDSECDELIEFMSLMYFIPGGRYLYYGGRPSRYYNNCYLFRVETDNREEWAKTVEKAASALMTGGGIGFDYSILRPNGSPLKSTGGHASGPIPLMEMVNEVGRGVMQGGSRRSAIYASLNWQHADAKDFLKVKDWDTQMVGNTGLSIGDLKKSDFNFKAPLDFTNISLNYDNAFLAALEKGELPETYMQNVRFALMNGEPGFSFNFNEKENETLRNACTEVVSEDDSDVCNLGSVNMGRVPDLTTFVRVVELATKFLLCGTIRAQLPTEKIRQIREKNRRLGLGLMGMHEWLLKRNYRYEVTPELHRWLQQYQDVSDSVSKSFADTLSVNHPVAVRAIAPTGTIGILAGTTTGIEPLFAVAFKRRYLKGRDYYYQYVIDGTAKTLIDEYGLNPENIESAVDLAADYERRIKFQYDVQKYVDQSISSTINLPQWGSDLNNKDKVKDFAKTLAKYAHGLRGFTVYPDGARGGQPLTAVPYTEAILQEGLEFQENDACKGVVCGV